MSTPAWADPPPIGGPHSPQAKWMERLRPLMKEPGRWAVIKSGTPSAMYQTANNLRLRQVHVPRGDWEFTVRTFRRGVHVGDMNVAQLYARFLGSWDENRVLDYKIAQDAEWNDEGQRICPDCGVPLPRPESGPWQRKCADCWSRIAAQVRPSNQRKWARRLLNRSSSGE